MIKGLNKTKEELQYRALDIDSSSSLKEFSMDRRKYYKKYILKEKVEDKDNLATNMGKLVETLLLEPEEFDNRFFMSSTAAPPTGLMLDFVEALYKITLEATDGFGVVAKDFADIIDEAYIASGFKITKEAVMKKFIGSNAEIYYKEIREVRSKNLTVVTTQDITNAERIVDSLKKNEFTADVINLESDERFTVINQMKIESYFVDGHQFKSMLDKVIVDNKEKIIRPYDLKCVWSVENFYNDYYLYRRAYIQASLYWKALVYLTQQKDSPFFGYKVEFLKFIVCDSINYYDPLIYCMSKEDMIDAYNGFKYNDRIYPGVKELILDLDWALQHDKWAISRKNYSFKGLVKIKS